MLLSGCCQVVDRLLSYRRTIRRRGLEFEFRFGSGPGIRTLNLAVNRSLHPVRKCRLEFAECRRVPPFAMVYRRRCCTQQPWAREPADLVNACIGMTGHQSPKRARSLWPCGRRSNGQWMPASSIELESCAAGPAETWHNTPKACADSTRCDDGQRLRGNCSSVI